MIKISEEKCTGCGCCVNLCPDEALNLNEKDFMVVDDSLCTECKVCARACPMRAITVK